MKKNSTQSAPNAARRISGAGIRTESDLIKAISFYTRQSVAKIADDVAEKLAKETESRVYKNTPKRYERTYEFAESIDIDYDYGAIGYDLYSSRVYFNHTKMSVDRGMYRYSSYGKEKKVYYGIHANAKGEDVRPHLAKWLNDGHKKSSPRVYNKKGKPIGLHRYERRRGAKMFEATEAWLNASMPMLAKKAYAMYGVDILPK